MTLSEERQKEPRRARMAGKKDAKQKASPCDRAEESKERSSGEPEKEPRRDPGEQGSSLGRYVFGSEISYNKAPPRLPGLGC